MPEIACLIPALDTGDMTQSTLISPAEYRVMPWRNGQGTTTEIAVAPGEAGRFQASVRPDAVDDWQATADLLLRDVEHALLLLERTGGDFGRMGIHRDGGYPGGRGDMAQMRAKAFLVD